MATTVEGLFQQGMRFMNASTIINRVIKGQEVVPKSGDPIQFVVPLMVNRIFALELFLKCLCLMQGGQPRKTHQLVELWQQLNRVNQQRIEDHFKGTPDHTEEMIAAAGNALGPEDIARFRSMNSVLPILTHANRGFEEFRYAFEGKFPTIHRLGYVILAVQTTIADRRPELDYRKFQV
jgi:hypothetical protein